MSIGPTREASGARKSIDCCSINSRGHMATPLFVSTLNKRFAIFTTCSLEEIQVGQLHVPLLMTNCVGLIYRPLRISKNGWPFIFLVHHHHHLHLSCTSRRFSLDLLVANFLPPLETLRGINERGNSFRGSLLLSPPL